MILPSMIDSGRGDFHRGVCDRTAGFVPQNASDGCAGWKRSCSASGDATGLRCAPKGCRSARDRVAAGSDPESPDDRAGRPFDRDCPVFSREDRRLPALFAEDANVINRHGFDRLTVEASHGPERQLTCRLLVLGFEVGRDGRRRIGFPVVNSPGEGHDKGTTHQNRGCHFVLAAGRCVRKTS